MIFKVGDLVRLVSDFQGDAVSIAETPQVSDSGQFWLPGGSPAIFMGWHTTRMPMSGEAKALILIGNRMGWVYESELEPFDEAR
jgi:hypothetical protein